MNQTDFFLIYLNLANQKAINNFLVNSKLVITYSSLCGKTAKHEEQVKAEQSALQKTNLIKFKKLGPVKTSIAKEAFALLAFAGLHKTIVVAEWKNPFGGKSKEILNNTRRSSVNQKTAPSSIININEASKQKLLSYDSSNLLGVQTLRFSNKNLFCLLKCKPGGTSQSLEKLTALIRFKKTINFSAPLCSAPFTLLTKPYKPVLTLPFLYSSTAKLALPYKENQTCSNLLPKVASKSRTICCKYSLCNKIAKQRQTVGKGQTDFGADQTSGLKSAWLKVLDAPKKTKDWPLGLHLCKLEPTVFKKGETNRHYYGATNSAISFKKQAAQLINKKLITSFNQRLFSQSFKYNFILHLKNCEDLLGLGNGLFREDHKMSLTSWAPIFDLNSLLSRSKFKAYSGGTIDDTGITSTQKVRASEDQQLIESTYARLCSLNKLNFFEATNTAIFQKNSIGPWLGSCLALKKTFIDGKSCGSAFTDSQSEIYLRFVQSKDHSFADGQAFRFGKDISFFTLSGVKSKITTGKNSSLQSKFCREVLNKGPVKRLEDSLNKVRRNSFMAKTSLIKELFSSTKKENLLASGALTKFYTASWLLESIRASLSLKNANIKRVLNQTLLLTQQPIFDSNKKKIAKSSFKATRIIDTKTGLKQSPDQRNRQLKRMVPLDKKPLSTKLQEAVAFNSTETLITALNSKQYVSNIEGNGEATVMPYLIKGLRITFSGRLGGKKGMAKTLTKTAGVVPLSTLKEKVDFAKGVVQTKAGSLGVKIWICYN